VDASLDSFAAKTNSSWICRTIIMEGLRCWSMRAQAWVCRQSLFLPTTRRCKDRPFRQTSPITTKPRSLLLRLPELGLPPPFSTGMPVTHSMAHHGAPFRASRDTRVSLAFLVCRFLLIIANSHDLRPSERSLHSSSAPRPLIAATDLRHQSELPVPNRHFQAGPSPPSTRERATP